MNDKNKNIQNAFDWVVETYRFTTSFLDRLQVAMEEHDPPLVEVSGKRCFTRRSYSSVPEDLLTRAIGAFYWKDQVFFSKEIPTYCQVPFVMFRFLDRDTGMAHPELIFGHLEEIEANGAQGSVQSLFRRMAGEAYTKLDRTDPTITVDGVEATVKCSKDPFSTWIEDNEEAQDLKIEEFADELRSRYTMG